MHELNFLPRSLRKGIDLPKKVIIEEYSTQNYGGYYDSETEHLVAVYRPDDNMGSLASTLAHEFKHYLQHKYPNKIRLKNSGYLFNNLLHKFPNSYNTRIRSYFRTIDSEYDALLFEVKYASNSLNEFWLKALVNPQSIKDIDSIYIQ